MVSPAGFYARAYHYVRREKPDDIDWARGLTAKKFLRMGSSNFMAEYVWVVYAAGFRVATLEAKFPALRRAFTHFNLHRMAGMRTAAGALRVIANARKACCVLRGAQLIAAEGFARFKQRVRREGPDALMALPGIGPITKDHLARNVGLASVAKGDVHIERVRRLFHCSSKDEFARYLSNRFRHPEGVVEQP